MADLAAWNDSDDDEPRKKKPHVDEAVLEREVFGEDASDDESNNISNEDAPAWQDDDDEDIRVDLRSASRLKKLRQAPTDRVLKGAALEERLRARFKATKGPQDWATASKPNALAEAAQDDESDDDDGDLRVARETDANVRAPSKSAISGVAFHASTDLLVTGGLDKTLRFFRIDGEVNGTAGACHLADLPVRSLAWRAQTDTCIVSGRRPFYYAYDVASEKATKVRLPPKSKDKSLERFALSGDGASLAFTAHDGRILLADASRGQWRSSELKASGTTRAVCFSHDSTKLYASGGDARARMSSMMSPFGSAPPKRHEASVPDERVIPRAAPAAVPRVLAQIPGHPAFRGRLQLHLPAAVLELQQHGPALEVLHEPDALATEAAQQPGDLVPRRAAAGGVGVGELAFRHALILAVATAPPTERRGGAG